MNSTIRHVAIIMDGNRRWAKAKGVSAKEGHKEGVEALERTVKAAIKERVEYLTVYALSTENLKERQKNELQDLFSLIKAGFVNKLPILKKEGICVNFFGNLEQLPFSVRKILEATEKTLENNKTLFLNIAINYGSREEIIEAAKKADRLGLNEEIFSQNLYTKGVPDPELVIRTGGQQRLSNFLLWQVAYSELYFTDVLWPEFNENEFKKAVGEFEQRKRNFGA